jgi:ADP-heptose:LPS heptosyltransferase
VQAERFDLAVQLHGSGTLSNPLTALFGARRMAGFYVRGAWCPDPELFLPYIDHGLEVRRLLALMAFLGAGPCGDHLEFPVHARDEEALRRALGGEELRPGEYVCIHPGASVPQRRWPVEHFTTVARALARRGFRIVLTGTAHEAALTRAVGRELRGRGLDLAGRTDLGSAAALLRGARLLVSNDTGVSHLAAALAVPSVVLSTGNNPERWAPADGRRHRVLCPADKVRPGDVLAQVDDLLGVGAASRAAPASLASESHAVRLGSPDLPAADAASRAALPDGPARLAGPTDRGTPKPLQARQPCDLSVS